MKLKYSIGIATKMIFIVTLIVVSAIGVVVYIATDLFREDSVTRVQELNKDTAQQMAERVHAIFLDQSDRLKLLAQFASRSTSPEESLSDLQRTLSSSDDFVSFTAFKILENQTVEKFISVYNDSALVEFGLAESKFEIKFDSAKVKEVLTHTKGVSLKNSSNHFGVPLLSMSFLSDEDKNKTRWYFVSELRQDKLIKLFNSKNNMVYFLVDGKGKLMAHSDPNMNSQVLKSSSFLTNPLVEKMIENQADNHQTTFETEDGEKYLGAFKKVGVAETGVVVQVSEKTALATIERVLYRSFLVMIVVVCIAFVFNFIFSQTLTSNLKRLFAATEQVVTGNFNVDLKVKSSDEIGALAQAFLKMTDGLRERDKIKDVFDKFQSKEIAKKLLSGEIKLGGEKKYATVFFSDIRGFTSMSEKMSPDQVVTVLNDYFTHMVKIIFSHGGVVDKYIGDAIMAVWGVPESRKDDAIRAIKACLEMRKFMKTYSEQLVKKGKPEIKVGMGLHSGELVAGNIGSTERLSYTVIDDTVNQASRIEGATKTLQTDFLISEDFYLNVKDKGVVVGPPVSIKAKGKSKPLIVYQVIGMQDSNGKLQTSLTQEEIQKIQSGEHEIKESEESKTQLVSAHQQDSLNEKHWTLLASDGTVVGEFSEKELAIKVRNNELEVDQYFAYLDSVEDKIPLNEVPGVSRRSGENVNHSIGRPETVIRNLAESHEWYVAGPENQTLGPYTDDELRVALGKGHITRNSLVWEQGMNEWQPLYTFTEFDRRNVA